MSLVLRKAITKELHASGLAGRVDGAAITLLAEFFEQNYGGHLDALPEILKLCQAGRCSQGDTGQKRRVMALLVLTYWGAQTVG